MGWNIRKMSSTTIDVYDMGPDFVGMTTNFITKRDVFDIGPCGMTMWLIARRSVADASASPQVPSLRSG